MTTRRAGSRPASPAATAANEPTGHRRNGFPALTCITISRWSPYTPARASRSARTLAVRSPRAISTGYSTRIRRSDVERGEQVPLVLHRMPRPQFARARDSPRVHPAPADNCVAHAHRRAAQPRENRGARAAVEIDDDVVRRRAQAADELHLGAEPADAARTRRDNQLVDIGIVLDDRRRGRLDEVCDVGLWKAPPDRSNGRRREDDVPDLPQPDQQDLQSSIVASSMSITGMSSLIG